jgi:hypothetical protein
MRTSVPARSVTFALRAKAFAPSERTTEDKGTDTGTDGASPSVAAAAAPKALDTLVLSAGGPDGISFVGAIRWLEGHAPRALAAMRTLVGCSAGAIVALFLSLGMSSDDMRAWVARGFEGGALTEADLDGVFSLIDRCGIDDGAQIVDALREVVRERLGDPHATFADVERHTGRRLVVCVSNLDSGERELLSVDTAPGMSVVLAVRMSISIPLLFTPVVHAGSLYVDGAIFDFCPTDCGGTGAALVLVIADTTVRKVRASAADLDIADYVALLGRAIKWRTRVGGACAGRDDAYVVRIPSLMLDPEHPSCFFSLQRLSLVTSPETVERYMAHGYARMAASSPSVSAFFSEH